MRLHLLDGTYELFRAHFSKAPPHPSPDGKDVKATLGLLFSLLALLNDPKEAVSHLAVAFDNPIRSFRNDLYAGYKTEEGVPEELLAQFDLAEEAVRALGICVWSMKELEADDALASGAAQLAPQVEQVRILTPDKDLQQCLIGEKVVMVDRRRERVLTEAWLRQERGFGPASVPDFLALVGDSADGIPGVNGFGEKTAAALLAKYGRLESIPKDPAAWEVAVRQKEKLGAALQAASNEVFLYRKLATLVRDAPLGASIDALRLGAVRPDALDQIAAQLGTKRLPVRERQTGRRP